MEESQIFVVVWGPALECKTNHQHLTNWKQRSHVTPGVCLKAIVSVDRLEMTGAIGRSDQNQAQARHRSVFVCQALTYAFAL